MSTAFLLHRIILIRLGNYIKTRFARECLALETFLSGKDVTHLIMNGLYVIKTIFCTA